MPSGGGRTTAAQPQALCVWDCIYVKNRRFLRTVKPFVTMVQGNGPTTIAIDISRTVRNSFSATVSVSAEVVTAGVGFNVEASETVAYKSSTAVPAVPAGRSVPTTCSSIRVRDLAGAVHRGRQEDRHGTARNFQGIEFRLQKWC